MSRGPVSTEPGGQLHHGWQRSCCFSRCFLKIPEIVETLEASPGEGSEGASSREGTLFAPRHPHNTLVTLTRSAVEMVAKRPAICTGGTLLVVSSLFAAAMLNAKSASEPPMLFDESHNLGVAYDLWGLVGDKDVASGVGYANVVPIVATPTSTIESSISASSNPTSRPSPQPSHLPTSRPSTSPRSPTSMPSPAPTSNATAPPEPTPQPTEAAQQNTVEVNLLWDLRSTVSVRRGDRSNGGLLGGLSEEQQSLALDACLEVYSDPTLQVVRRDSTCFMERLNLWLGASYGQSLPLPPASFRDAAVTFLYSFDLESMARPDCNSEELIWLRASYKTRVPTNLPAEELLRFFEKWKAFAKATNARYAETAAASGVRQLEVSIASWSWVQAVTESRMVASTVYSFVISLGISVVCVFSFTRLKVGTTVAAFLCILSINLTLIALMVVALEWSLGAVEAVSITVFVGFSVDYALHVSHAYASHHGVTATSAVPSTDDRSTMAAARAVDTVVELSHSILGAALTTSVSAIILCLCKIQIFVKMGITLLGCTLLSAFFALVVLPAFLLTFAKQDAQVSELKRPPTQVINTFALQQTENQDHDGSSPVEMAEGEGMVDATSPSCEDVEENMEDKDTQTKSAPESSAVSPEAPAPYRDSSIDRVPGMVVAKANNPTYVKSGYVRRSGAVSHGLLLTSTPTTLGENSDRSSTTKGHVPNPLVALREGQRGTSIKIHGEARTGLAKLSAVESADPEAFEGGVHMLFKLFRKRGLKGGKGDVAVGFDSAVTVDDEVCVEFVEQNMCGFI